MENLETYFANEYVSKDSDPHVIRLVTQSQCVLDVGCGDNLFKKQIRLGTFTGIDLYNKNADIMCDILDYKTNLKFDLIICFGSINFYDIKWIDDRMHKVFSLLKPGGTICMKVNPGEPFENGKKLAWFDRWTVPLAKHYAELYNMKIEHLREGSRKRIKWDYVTK